MPIKNSTVSARGFSRAATTPVPAQRRAPKPASTPASATPASGRRLLPIKEAANRLGLSVWGLRAWVYAGKCASHKIGDRVMLSESEVERIIRESERPALA